MADQAPPERVAAHLLLCEPAADSRVVAGCCARRLRLRFLRGRRTWRSGFWGGRWPSRRRRVSWRIRWASWGRRRLWRVGSSRWRASISSGLRRARPIRRCAAERVRVAARARVYMGDFAGAAALLGRERASLGEAERSVADAVVGR